MHRFVRVLLLALIVVFPAGAWANGEEWSPPAGPSRPVHARDIKKLDSSATVKSVSEQFGPPIASIVPVPALCYGSADKPNEIYVFEFQWIEAGKLWPNGKLGLVSLYEKGSEVPKDIIWFNPDPSVGPRAQDGKKE